MHWAARKRRLDDWAICTKAAWRVADNKESLTGKKIVVQVTIPFKANARRDPHNYVGTNVKTIVDALIREGMTIDDTSEYIEVLEPKLVTKSEDVVICLLPTTQIGAKK